MQKYSPLKIILFFLLITIVLFSQKIKPDSTEIKKPIIGFDKIQHTAISCLLTLSGQYVLESKSNMNKSEALNYSISSSAIVGLTKELNDKRVRSQPFDWGDMIANLIGIGLAVLIII